MTEKSSRFIFSTNFATLKNDAIDAATLTLPNSVTINNGNNVIWSVDLHIGASSTACFRSIITSSKYDYAITTKSFSIAAKQDGNDSELYGSIYRINSNTFRVDIIANGGDGETPTTWTDMGQTLTIQIQTFINPLDPNF